MLLKMEARIKGMQVEGAPMPIDGTLKMETGEVILCCLAIHAQQGRTCCA
jgi:hypothetical protein